MGSQAPMFASDRARPFTPETLAERWMVSDETVRQLIKRGELRAFRVGRMFRIPADAVEEYETCQNTASDASTGDLSSHGTRMDDAGGIVLRHARSRKPRQKP